MIQSPLYFVKAFTAASAYTSIKDISKDPERKWHSNTKHKSERERKKDESREAKRERAFSFLNVSRLLQVQRANNH